MKRKNLLKGSVALSILTVGFVAGLMMLWSAGDVIEKQVIEPREWQPVQTGNPYGDWPDEATASGVVGVFVVNHTASPATMYAWNITNASTDRFTVYAFGLLWESGAGNLSGNVPYGTAFDIVVRVRWNKTCAYSTNNNTWMNSSWTNASITAANDAGTTTYFPIDDVNMGNINVTYNGPTAEGWASDGDYIWCQYYIQAKAAAGGAGLQISHGDTVNCSNFAAWAYY